MTPGEVMMWGLTAVVVALCICAIWGLVGYQLQQSRLRRGPKAPR